MADGPARPLRLLSLDGGGVRGLTSLLILRQLMHQLGSEDTPAKPCQYFDIIAGTSTGGLIAIMLGILEMDVDTCIEAYQKLAKKVFRPKRGRSFFGGVGKIVGGLVGSSAFEEVELEKAIKEVLKGRNLPADAEFVSGPSGCKVFVMATLGNASHVKIRSYRHPKEASVVGKFTIVGAARATSAAPGFFPAYEHGGLKFVDGALGENNPVNQLYQEARTLYVGSTIGCLVSIGTGVSRDLQLGSSLIGVARGCAAIATDTSKIAQQFEDSYAAEGRELCNRYFRFNVEQGVVGVGLDEWSKASKMTTATHKYLEERRTKKEIDKCVSCLKEVVAPATLQLPSDHLPRSTSPASFASQAPPSSHGPERPTLNAQSSTNSAFSPPLINSSSTSPYSSPAPQHNPYQPPQQPPYQQSSQYPNQVNLPQERNSYQAQQPDQHQRTNQALKYDDQYGILSPPIIYEPRPMSPDSYHQNDTMALAYRRGHESRRSINSNDYPGNYNRNPNYNHNQRQDHWDDHQYEGHLSNLDYFNISEASYFVPRQPIMDQILQNIKENRVCTLVGIGGSGKTQLALKIANNHQQEYSVVFWFEAKGHPELTQSFFRIAQMLGLAPPRYSQMRESQLTRRHEQDYIIAVKQWLSKRRSPYLLVFDNCDEKSVLEGLKQYFPNTGGHILVTSRRDDAINLVAHGVEVKGLEEEEAVDLLLKHARISNPSDEELVHARQIIKKLDGLALAVDLAGGFIRQQRSSLETYVQEYEQRNAAVLEKLFKQQKTGTYPNTVFTAWDLSISKMTEGARQLIYLLSFLDRTNIRLDLFYRCTAVRKRWNEDGTIRCVEPEESGVPDWMTSLLLSPAGSSNSRGQFHHNQSGPERSFNLFGLNELISEICSFSFAKVEFPQEEALYEYTDSTIFKTTSTRYHDRRVLYIHPLLHEIARLYLPEDEQEKHATSAQRILWHSIDDDADECVRDPDNPQYSPMITLAGGATIEPVRLALRLDETYRHLSDYLKKLLQEKMAEVPEVGTFASLLVCFDLLYLVRTASDPTKAFFQDQSCGWDKLNNEIKRARLLTRPNILHQWMTIATRAPEIWRKEFSAPSSYEKIAKAEKKLYEGFKRKKGLVSNRNWSGYVDEKKLLMGQGPIPGSDGLLYEPMWNNIVVGVKAVREWDPEAKETEDLVALKDFDTEWDVGPKVDPKLLAEASNLRDWREGTTGYDLDREFEVVE